MNKNVYFSGATWPNIYLLIAIVLVAIFTGGYFAMLLMTITLLAVQNKMYIDGEDIVFIPFFGGKIRHIKATELQNARWKLSQCSITYGNGSKFIFIPNAIGARKKITMLLANRTTDVSPEVVQES